MNETDAVRALAALAQSARLRIFRALVGAGPDGLTPGLLSATLDIPGSTLSFHLKELIHAGLVSVQRDGRSLIYRPELARMDSLVAYLGDHCCQARPAAAASDVSAAACAPVCSTTGDAPCDPGAEAGCAPRPRGRAGC